MISKFRAGRTHVHPRGSPVTMDVPASRPRCRKTTMELRDVSETTTSCCQISTIPTSTSPIMGQLQRPGPHPIEHELHPQERIPPPLAGPRHRLQRQRQHDPRMVPASQRAKRRGSRSCKLSLGLSIILCLLGANRSRCLLDQTAGNATKFRANYIWTQPEARI